MMNSKHFAVDGMLIEGWATDNSFQRKNGDDRPGNEAHESKTNPDARVNKEPAGQEVNGATWVMCWSKIAAVLSAPAMTTEADGTPERDAARFALD